MTVIRFIYNHHNREGEALGMVRVTSVTVLAAGIKCSAYIIDNTYVQPPIKYDFFAPAIFKGKKITGEGL